MKNTGDIHWEYFISVMPAKTLVSKTSTVHWQKPQNTQKSHTVRGETAWRRPTDGSFREPFSKSDLIVSDSLFPSTTGPQDRHHPETEHPAYNVINPLASLHQCSIWSLIPIDVLWCSEKYHTTPTRTQKSSNIFPEQIQQYWRWNRKTKPSLQTP